jgi:hypothetical protein
MVVATVLHRLLVPRQLNPAAVATVLHTHSQLFLVVVAIVLNSQLFLVVVATLLPRLLVPIQLDSAAVATMLHNSQPAGFCVRCNHVSHSQSVTSCGSCNRYAHAAGSCGSCNRVAHSQLTVSCASCNTGVYSNFAYVAITYLHTSRTCMASPFLQRNIPGMSACLLHIYALMGFQIFGSQHKIIVWREEKQS